MRCRTKPGLELPVSVAPNGLIVDAGGHTIASTYAPGDLDWPAQDRFRRAMAELITKALNKT